MALEVALDFQEVSLDSLDLDEGGVGELGEESEALVDGAEGTVVFGNSFLEDLMLLLANEGFVVEGLSVLVDVASQLSQRVGESIPGGEEHIVDQVVGVEDISVGILDFLSQSSHVSVVVVSSSVELVDQLRKLSLQIPDQLLHGLNQLLEVPLSL